ncbi:tetratricopeptide repeat protein [Longilinea arvoryzae]|nr:tetratricopeptide repeat protein [Longilinea arvoryzae]
MTLPQNKSALLVSSAILLRQAGYDLKAIEVLQDAIHDDPGFAPAYVLLGALYQATSSDAQAEIFFRKALEIEPDNTEALQGLGLFLISQNRYSEALPYLEKHLQKNPTDSLSLDGLLEAFHHLPGREEKIQVTLKTAWEQSKNTEFGIRYGRYLLDQGDPQEARNVLTAVVEISTTARTLSELALTCLLTNDCIYATHLLQKAVEIDPQFDRAWRGLAQCYNEARNFDKGLEAAERAIAINPNHYRNWQAKSDVLLSLGQFDQALLASQKGIEIIHSKAEGKAEAEPVLAVLYLQRFAAFIRLGHLENAVAEMTLARQEIPNDHRFYQYPVEILSTTNQANQALEILDSVSNPDLMERLAALKFKVLHQLGRSQEALNFIRPYLEKKSEERLNVLADIGADFYQHGLSEPAIAVYRQLVDLKPNDGRFSSNLGYFLIEKGETTQAEELLIQVADHPKVGLFGEIAHCDLAYLYNITGAYEKSRKASAAVLESKYRKEEAMLRVSFWVNGKMQPDPISIPGRLMTLEDAARACGAAAAMAATQITRAQSIVEDLRKDSANKSLVGMIAGCVEAAKGDLSAAIETWNQVLNAVNNTPDESALRAWMVLSK